jgi:hypothetical protein
MPVSKVKVSSIQSAKSALSGKSFRIIDGNKIIIPEPLLQDIILLKSEGV